MVLYDGLLVFSGRSQDAQDYFLDMGWEKKARQTTPDFLTACTSPNERRVRLNALAPPPQTAAEMAAYWQNSPERERLLADIEYYKANVALSSDADLFRQAVRHSKAKGTGKANSYKVPFYLQVAVLIRRQMLLIKADRTTFLIRMGSNVLQATIIGAICYKPSQDANGSYELAGALFFAVLYFTIFAFGEIPPTVQGRPLLIKHRKQGHYNPAAKTIAEMVVDAPLFALQTLVFAAILYFLIGLNSGARYFFTFWFVIYSVYMALAVMYRMLASWSPNVSVAVRYGAMTLSLILTVAGYILPEPLQLGWASWIRRISPVSCVPSFRKLYKRFNL